MSMQPDRARIPVTRRRSAGMEPLALQVLGGLSRRPKRLSSSLLYDERGSSLFEEICALPEYYITRTELAILKSAAPSLGTLLTQRLWLVEPGSGASVKTRVLLDALPGIAGYMPVDISAEHLAEASRRLRAAYPGLAVQPVCADFTQPLVLPRQMPADERVLVFFPGSTIGNFDAPEALELLSSMRRLAGADGGLLIGFDLVKEPQILRRAYNDAAGVTAAFNLNLLTRLNRELGTRFDVEAFRHEALWVEKESRIEMRLVSRRRQQVLVCGERIVFEAGEPLVTEHCHKYTPEGFDALARGAGWTPLRAWNDERRCFQVEYLHGYNDS